MEFSRQEYWSGLYFLSPEDLPEPGIEPWSPASQADSLPFELQESLYSIPLATTHFKELELTMSQTLSHGENWLHSRSTE